MSPASLVVVILSSSVLFFMIAHLYPKLRSLFLTVAFYTVLTGIFAAYSNWLPQAHGETPPLAIKPDLKSVYSMTTQELADLGETIIFGKVGGFKERAIGRGQCPLCHVFKPGDIGNRAPTLFGIGKTAALRIKDPGYLHPNTVQTESFSGSGRATTAEEYIAESQICSSCYVVPGYGARGSHDRESPGPDLNKPPISLTIDDFIAIDTWLYVNGGEPHPSPKEILAAYEKFIPVSERRYSGPQGTILASDGTIVSFSESKFAQPPMPPIAFAADTLDQIVTKMGCFACHQIPGLPSAKFGEIGPLLIQKSTAQKRMESSDYQARVKTGMAHAKTPKEYVIESIVRPNAFIVPRFVQKNNPEVSPMIQDYGRKFTYDALDKLADYLLTLDCESAKKDGLTGPPQEPTSKVCGDAGH